jgi:hypothetical protein
MSDTTSYPPSLRSPHSHDGGRLDFMPFGQVALCESRPWKWQSLESVGSHKQSKLANCGLFLEVGPPGNTTRIGIQ